MLLKTRHRLLLLMLLMLCAWGVQQFMTPDLRMKRYAGSIESYLQKREELSRRQLETIMEALQNGKGDLAEAQTAALLDYNIAVYRENRLQYWLNRRVLPGIAPLLQNPDDSLAYLWENENLLRFRKYKNGRYLIKGQSFRTAGGVWRAVTFIPLQDAWQLPENAGANSSFYPRRHFPKGVGFTQTATDYPIRLSDGRAITWLTAPAKLPPDRLQLYLLLLFLVPAVVLLLLEINKTATRLSRNYRPWAGLLFLLIALAGLRALSIYGGWFDFLRELPLFANTFQTQVVNSSLGELLINIGLLLWLVVFFQREFPLVPIQAPSRVARALLSLLYYLSVVGAILLIISTLQRIVVQSDIPFDFENVLNLHLSSLLAIGGVVLLMFVLFLFSHRMAQSVLQMNASLIERMLIAALATTLAYPLYKSSGLHLPFLESAIGIMVFIGLLDFYIDAGRPNITWLIGWLIVLSGFTSLLLYKYNLHKEVLLLETYARRLASPRDHLAEAKLKQCTPPKNATQQEVDAWLRDFTEKHFYLGAYYDFVWREESREDLPAGRWVLDSLSRTYLFSLPLRASPEDSATSEPGEEFRTLMLQRDNKWIPTAYRQTGLTPPYRGLRELPAYDYAVYRGGTLAEQSEREYYPLRPYTATPLPVDSLLPVRQDNNRLEYAYRKADGTLVVIGRKSGGMLKPLSLFSYLFALLFLAIFILSVLNRRFGFLPEGFYLSRLSQASLGNRIQEWMIGLTLLSFFSIGLLTAWYFRKAADIERERQVRQRINTLTSELRPLLKGKESSKLLTGYAPKIRELARRHRLDINLYASDGSLLQSSEKGIYLRQFVEPVALYPAVAQQYNAGSGKLQLYPDMLTRDVRFLSIYLGLDGQYLLGIPYYRTHEEVRQSVADFIGTLLNVYVFLLLITSSVALGVTESITQPLKNLRASLQSMRLGRNEPLSWESEDEVGALIAEYNATLKKLEESARKLAESERESAWREMAKQVAHEIKNPLTPIRLSIQHLEMAHRRDPQMAAEMIEKVSKRILEQIDTLANIASAFSRYAKMPPPENERFLLNELVQSVFELFQKEGGDTAFELELPEEELYVFADRSQLMRVLNNLLKNAIQAIPNDRQGRIRLSVKRQNDKVRIAIQDNGSGIPEELREKVFRPNFTTKSSGSGLGLAMSKNIIRAANGRLWFETEMGVGSVFWVEIPLAPGA